jgi:hypothetical protein
LAACETARVAVPVKPPADRMDCRFLAGGRPALPAEYVIDWSKVLTVDQARSEHDAYVRSVRTREGIVAGYVVTIEGKLFLCSSDAEWMTDFFARLPDG